MLTMQFDIVPFNIISSGNDYPILETTNDQAPAAFHISRERFEEALEAGWNRSVLPSYKYELLQKQYQLPDVPPYEDWVQACTCRNNKRPLLEVSDVNGLY